MGLSGTTDPNSGNIRMGGTGPILYGKSSGNLGIGSTNPIAKLQVNGSISTEWGYTLSVGTTVVGYPLTLMTIQNDVASYAALIDLRDSDGQIGSIYHGHNGTIGFLGFDSFSPNNVAKRPIVFAQYGGNVGIGTNNVNHLLTLNGGAYCEGTGAWVSGSDIAYKTDVTSMKQYGLKEILQLNPVTYVHKQDKNKTVQLGFIAQEVKPVLPEVVEGEEGQMGIAYDRIIPVLVNAIKELQKENDVLKQKIEELGTK
jgi:hypothetical protein